MVNCPTEIPLPTGVRHLQPEPLLHRIDAAIRCNAFGVCRDVFLESQPGKIILQGKVDSFYQKQMVQESLRGIDGVPEISNLLEVEYNDPLAGKSFATLGDETFDNLTCDDLNHILSNWLSQRKEAVGCRISEPLTAEFIAILHVWLEQCFLPMLFQFLADTTGSPEIAELLRLSEDSHRIPLKPSYDATRRELSLGGVIVKRFRVPARNQELILSAFAEEGWPAQIDDPLPNFRNVDARTRLHDVINRLNRSQINCLMSFHGNGLGDGVRWQLRDASPSNLAFNRTTAKRVST